MKASIDIRDGLTIVIVDGVEIPVTDLEVHPSPQKGVLPVLVLTVPLEADLNIEGVVVVRKEATEEDVRESASDWLQGADRDVVRSLVQERMRTLADHPVDKTLEVMAELVRNS